MTATSPIPDVAPVMTTTLPAMDMTSAHDIEVAEEETYLLHSGLWRVGTMNGIGFDGLGKVLANCSGRSLGRIGSPHDLAILRDRVLSLQHLYDNGTARHELDEASKEWSRLMDAVEGFRLGGRKTHAPLSYDTKSGLFQPGDDLSGQIAARCVRLDDRQRALSGHFCAPSVSKARAL